MAVGQNQRYHVGAFGAPPILASFSWGLVDVHRGYGDLTHGRICVANVSGVSSIAVHVYGSMYVHAYRCHTYYTLYMCTHITPVYMCVSTREQ